MDGGSVISSSDHYVCHITNLHDGRSIFDPCLCLFGHAAAPPAGCTSCLLLLLLFPGVWTDLMKPCDFLGLQILLLYKCYE